MFFYEQLKLRMRDANITVEVNDGAERLAGLACSVEH
jgi:hypothetical protein